MESNFQDRLENFLKANNQAIYFQQLTPDASTREYFRVEWNDGPAIACVYPADELGETQFAACLDVTDVFLSAGLPVARVFAADAAKGIIIHEDFGDTILRDVLLASAEPERDRLLNEAITLIARIQAATPNAFAANSISSRLRFDEEKLLWELGFFNTHYFESLMKSPLSAAENELLEREFLEIARELDAVARVLCHRDFHAANLMLQNGGLKIIDHQDARIGSITYDLVSLLLDRVTELPDLEWLSGKYRYFDEERVKLGLEPLAAEIFTDEFQLQTIQRCLKAAGTFSYQSAFRGKTHFIQYIKPMFQIVLRACESLDRFPVLREILSKELSVSGEQ